MKPLFEVAVMEHGGGPGKPAIRLRFRQQDHTVPPVDFYLETDPALVATHAKVLEEQLAELRGSELDPGEVVDRVTRDYDLQECAMRIYVANFPTQYPPDPKEAFDAAEAFIAEAKRREEAK